MWDWNGTLFDDLDVIVSSTSDTFVAFGLPPVSVEQHRALFCRPITRFYERLLGRPVGEEEWRRLDRAFHDEYRRHIHRCELAAGAAETLAAWQQAGRTQSLLSMWRHDELVPLVGQLGIASRFLRVDGLRGDTGGHKAEHLERHLASLAIDPADVALIGDSLDDAAAAERVGARCILYSGGFHSPESLAEAGLPVAETLAEAVNLLDGHLR